MPGREPPSPRIRPRRSFTASLLAGLLALALASGGPAIAGKPPTAGGTHTEDSAPPPPADPSRAARAAAAAAPVEQPGPPLGPDVAASASDVAQLRNELRAASDRLARQDDELKALRLRLDDTAARADAAAGAAGRVPATVDQRVRELLDANPTVAAIRRGLSLSGFLQADYQKRESSDDQLNPTSGQPLNQDLFFVRRARLRLTADYGIVGGLVELDGNTVNGTTARLIGLEASLRYPAPTPDRPAYIGLTAGLFKIPFGFEIGQRDVDRLFMERSTSERALFPGEYDLGVRIGGGWRFLRYAIAALNGEPLGEKGFAGRDPNSAKDCAGRVGVDVGLGSAVQLTAGFSALYGTGFHKGNGVTKDVLVWRDTNENGVPDAGEIQSLTGQAATPSSSFNRFALGGDVTLRIRIPVLGELMTYGEVVVASNLDRAIAIADPVSSGRDLREIGWYVAGTLDLTRWAQIGARYDVYNPDADATDLHASVYVPADQSYSTVSIVGALRYAGLARLSAEYQINRNHLGRDSSGRPVALADNALLVRAQLVF